MLIPFFAAVFLLLFLALTYYGQWREFLAIQRAFYQQLRWYDVALGVLAVVLIPAANEGIVALLTPVAPTVAAAIAASAPPNPYGWLVWVNIALVVFLNISILLVMGTAADSIKTYFTTKRGWLNLLISAMIICTLCAFDGTTLGMAVWYVLQVTFALAVFGICKYRGATTEDAAQRVANAYAAQFILFLVILAVLRVLLVIAKFAGS